jgi:hypothetical protein
MVADSGSNQRKLKIDLWILCALGIGGVVAQSPLPRSR